MKFIDLSIKLFIKIRNQIATSDNHNSGWYSVHVRTSNDTKNMYNMYNSVL